MNIVWRKDWIYEYESPWSIFEKVSLANLVGRNEILHVFGTPQVKGMKQHIGDVHRELMCLTGFNLDLLDEILGFNLKEHNQKIIQSLISPFHAYFNSPDPWFYKDLHWCSKCLEGGFHSWLHQFKLLDECVFHELKLNNICPNCKEGIPFLLSNKRLDCAFQCKCGHRLAIFHESSWNEWMGAEHINQAVLRWIQSNMNQENLETKWIVHPNHCNLKMLIEEEPEEIKHIVSSEPIQQNYFHSNLFRKEQLKICSKTFQKIEKNLLQGILRNHHHCIHQLLELKKKDDLAEFPLICPYAYAYVFWRKSLLKEVLFYGFDPTRDDLTSNTAPMLIEDHIEYFVTQLITFQKLTYGTIDRNIIFWFLEKLVSEFSESFFRAWFEIAGKRSEKINVPKWGEILEMRDKSFPKVALKCSINKQINYIEYHLSKSNESISIKFDCPNQNETARSNIKAMNSYTPHAVALMVRGSKPDMDLIKLQKSVEAYVKKLNF
ncbi:hypothetical protein ACMX2M_07080 [Paenibacillus polymyxa]|uniref:hypothetical protein n=1 Tax=Paenibacillus sp. MABNR03 TaxID=3142626 RepID=UPI003D26C7CC